MTAALLWACTALSVGGSAANKSNKKLLVLLIDGFRWDYFEEFVEGDLPGFERLQHNGVKADHVQPVFPSYSFVNFYSLMTGES